MGNNNFSISNLGGLKKDLEQIFALRSKQRAIKEQEKECIDKLAMQYNIEPTILRKAINGLEKTEKQRLADEKTEHLLLLLKGAP